MSSSFFKKMLKGAAIGTVIVGATAALGIALAAKAMRDKTIREKIEQRKMSLRNKKCMMGEVISVTYQYSTYRPAKTIWGLVVDDNNNYITVESFTPRKSTEVIINKANITEIQKIK